MMNNKRSYYYIYYYIIGTQKYKCDPCGTPALNLLRSELQTGLHA